MSESVKTRRWSCGQIVKFLELYEQLPCLWNVHSQSYKNREKKVAAYEKLSKDMGIRGFSARDVIAKIRSLRNTYTLELNKILRSKRSGASEDNIYKPTVPWFSVADRILHKVVQLKETQSTETIQEENQSETEQAENQSENEQTENLSENEQPFEPLVIIDPSNDQCSSIESDHTPQSPSPPRPKKLKTSTISSTERAIAELKQISESLIPEDNEFDTFGRHVAVQLKKLPEVVALEAMGFIQAYLIEQRIKSTHSTPTSSNKRLRYNNTSHDSNNASQDFKVKPFL